MTNGQHMGSRLQQLREAFDNAFRAPAEAGRKVSAQYVIIRTGRERYALNIGELALIERLNQVVPLPAATPHLLGLTGVHGQLTAVFSLASLLGGQKPAQPGWIAVTRHDRSVALAFDAVEGVVDTAADDVRRAAEAAAGGYVTKAVEAGTGAVAVLSVGALGAAIAHNR